MRINKKIENISFPGIADPVCKQDNNGVILIFQDGSSMFFTHNQDCCEYVCLSETGGTFDRTTDFYGKVLLSITHDYSRVKEKGLEEIEFNKYTFQFNDGFIELVFRGETESYYSTAVDIYEKKNGSDKWTPVDL